MAVQSFHHVNVSRTLGLSYGHGLVPLLVLPYFPHGEIVSYLKRCPDMTEKEKIALVSI